MNTVIVSNVQTLPTRQNTMKKLRNRERAGVQRSFTIMNDGGGAASRGSSFDIAKPIESFDNENFKGENSETSNETATKRKDKKFRSSFLKKSMSRKQRSQNNA